MKDPYARQSTVQTRREILESVRSHLAASAAADAVYNYAGQKEKTRTPIRVSRSVGSLLEQFKESVQSVAGHCTIVNTAEKAAVELQKIIDEIKPHRVASTDAAILKNVLPQVHIEAEALRNAGKEELFDCDLGITGAQWAIAETGTLVLDSNAERHRLASLVPPVHVAVISATRIRETLAEVLEEISAAGKDALARTLTFVTGPSRTSDIELNLAIGVHGPGELYIIVIDNG